MDHFLSLFLLPYVSLPITRLLPAFSLPDLIFFFHISIFCTILMISSSLSQCLHEKNYLTLSICICHLFFAVMHKSKHCLGVVIFPFNLPSKNPLDCCSLVFPYFFRPTIPPISNVHFASSRLPFFPFSIRLSLHPATLAPQSIPAPTSSLHPSVCPTLPPFIQVLI